MNYAEIYGYLLTHVKEMYHSFDGGHDDKHFSEVFAASQKIADTVGMGPREKMLVMISAAYHDVGRMVDEKRHEEYSVIMFNNDQNMRRWLTKDERQIVSNTINEHRSNKGASSIYSKILKDADKVGYTNRDRFMERIVRSNVDHCNLDKSDPNFIQSITQKIMEKMIKLKTTPSTWQLECTGALCGERFNFDIPSVDEIVTAVESYIKEIKEKEDTI